MAGGITSAAFYLEHGHNGPQQGIEVFTVARRQLVARFAAKFASEQIHAQNAAIYNYIHLHMYIEIVVGY